MFKKTDGGGSIDLGNDDFGRDREGVGSGVWNGEGNT